MISVEHREAIRRAYFVDGKAIRQIAREFGQIKSTVMCKSPFRQVD